MTEKLKIVLFCVKAKAMNLKESRYRFDPPPGFVDVVGAVGVFKTSSVIGTV